MELIKALGLDIKILIAQLVNFSVLLFVLWKFGYKPMLKFLDDRKDKIEKGITDAEKAQKKLIEIEEKEKEAMKNAKKEALAIIEKAKASANEKRDDILKNAKKEIGKVIDAEKVKMQVEKAETLKEIKQESASFVIDVVEKVLEEKIGDSKDKELVKKIIKKLK